MSEKRIFHRGEIHFGSPYSHQITFFLNYIILEHDITVTFSVKLSFSLVEDIILR